MRLKKINNISLRCKIYTIKIQLKEARRKNSKNIQTLEEKYSSLKRKSKIIDR